MVLATPVPPLSAFDLLLLRFSVDPPPSSPICHIRVSSLVLCSEKFLTVATFPKLVGQLGSPVTSCVRMASVALVLGAGQKAVEWPLAQPLILTSTGAPHREGGPSLGALPLSFGS